MIETGRIGKYLIERRLGTGGMAEVFKCRLFGIGGFDKVVVVKRMLPHLAENTDFVAMFLDEARIAANLIHPNVVQTYEIAQSEDGTPFIAMEYVAGPTFAQIIHAASLRKRIDLAKMSKIIVQAAIGLDYAHNAKGPAGEALQIVHRDVSPHNMIVSLEGVTKILDFGVAHAEGRLSHTTRGAAVKGKSRFMAPELLRTPHAPLDRRIDVFSLGVCLYAATTGAWPFDGQNDGAVMEAVAKGDYKWPSEHCPDFPPQLEKIILAAMQPEPSARYADCRSMATELEAWLDAVHGPISEKDVADYVASLFEGQEGVNFGPRAYQTPTRAEPAMATQVMFDPASAPSHGTQVMFEAPAGLSHGTQVMFDAPAALKEGTQVMFEAPAMPTLTAAPPKVLRERPISGSPQVLWEQKLSAPSGDVPWHRTPEPQPVASAPPTKTSEFARFSGAVVIEPPPKPAQRLQPEEVPERALVHVSKPSLSEVIEIEAAPQRRSKAPLVVGALLLIAGLGTAWYWRPGRPVERAEARPFLDAAKSAISTGRLGLAKELVQKARAVPGLSSKESIDIATLSDALKVAELVEQANAALALDEVARVQKLLAQLEGAHPGSAEGKALKERLAQHQRARAPAPPPVVAAPASEPQPSLAVAPASPKTGQTPVGIKSLPSRRVSARAARMVPAPLAPLPVEPEIEEPPPVKLAEVEPQPEKVAPPPAPPLPRPAEAVKPEPTPVSMAMAAKAEAPDVDREKPQGDPIINCPEGSTVIGRAPPAGHSVWCAEEGGLRHGKFIRWYPNGQKAEQGAYVKGKKNGLWIEYFEDGTERERMTWRRGVKTW